MSVEYKIMIELTKKKTYDTSNDSGKIIDFADAVFVMAVDLERFQIQRHPSLKVDATGHFHQPEINERLVSL